jgi:hypothetical protein
MGVRFGIVTCDLSYLVDLTSRNSTSPRLMLLLSSLAKPDDWSRMERASCLDLVGGMNIRASWSLTSVHLPEGSFAIWNEGSSSSTSFLVEGRSDALLVTYDYSPEDSRKRWLCMHRAEQR